VPKVLIAPQTREKVTFCGVGRSGGKYGPEIIKIPIRSLDRVPRGKVTIKARHFSLSDWRSHTNHVRGRMTRNTWTDRHGGSGTTKRHALTILFTV
jgi:hypothetical protein